MKPNTVKPIKTPSDPKSYVLQRKLDILSRVYWMIANTQWNLNHSDVLDKLLDKFIDLSDGLGEEKLKEEMKLKTIMKGKLIHPKKK
jgi:hypothetical protein